MWPREDRINLPLISPNNFLLLFFYPNSIINYLNDIPLTKWYGVVQRRLEE